MKAVESWPAVEHMANFGFKVDITDFGAVLAKEGSGYRIVVAKSGPAPVRPPKNMSDPVVLHMETEDRMRLILRFKSVNDLTWSLSRG